VGVASAAVALAVGHLRERRPHVTTHAPAADEELGSAGLAPVAPGNRRADAMDEARPPAGSRPAPAEPQPQPRAGDNLARRAVSDRGGRPVGERELGP